MGDASVTNSPIQKAASRLEQTDPQYRAYQQTINSNPNSPQAKEAWLAMNNMVQKEVLREEK